MRRSSLHDHWSSSGDVVAWTYVIDVIGLDGLVARSIAVNVHVSNALSVSGNINDPDLVRDILANAEDAIGAYHMRQGGLVVPGRDVSIGGVAVKEIRIAGPIENREYTIAVLRNAAEAVRDMHLRRALAPITTTGTKIEI